MNTKQLWDYFEMKQVGRCRVGRRDYIWVKLPDFKAVEVNFRQERNVLHQGQSYRSEAYFKHLHVVALDDYAVGHVDHGNLRRCWLLAVVHGFCDVLPFFFYCWRSGQSVRHFFEKHHPPTSNGKY
jgi:hypothetical protein